MASVTAFIMVGTAHPNQIALYPEFTLELWEGSHATWVIRDQNSGQITARLEPEMPAYIAGAAIAYLSDAISRTPEMLSVVVAPMDNSSLLGQVHLFQNLEGCDLNVLSPIFTKVRDAWNDQWIVRDERRVIA